MASLWAQYIRERTHDHILEQEEGFIVYRFLPDNETCYITDIFIIPAMRKTGIASSLGNEVMKIARNKGYKYLLGSVVPSMKGSHVSLKVLIAYGMKLESASQDLILFRKEI